MRAAIGIGALLLVTAAPVSAGGWEPGVPYSAGPGCDINDNGIDDYYHNSETPFEYHVAGKVKGDTLTGKYMQRYDNVVLRTYEDPEALPEILWNGKLEIRGEFAFGDFADLSTLAPISDVIGFKWSYTFTDLDGGFLAVSRGELKFDTTTGTIVERSVYGPCWEP